MPRPLVAPLLITEPLTADKLAVPMRPYCTICHQITGADATIRRPCCRVEANIVLRAPRPSFHQRTPTEPITNLVWCEREAQRLNNELNHPVTLKQLKGKVWLEYTAADPASK